MVTTCHKLYGCLGWKMHPEERQDLQLMPSLNVVKWQRATSLLHPGPLFAFKTLTTTTVCTRAHARNVRVQFFMSLSFLRLTKATCTRTFVHKLQDSLTFSVVWMTAGPLFDQRTGSSTTVFHWRLRLLSLGRFRQSRSASLRSTHRHTEPCQTRTPHATSQLAFQRRTSAALLFIRQFRQSPAIFPARIDQSGESKVRRDCDVISGAPHTIKQQRSTKKLTNQKKLYWENTSLSVVVFLLFFFAISVHNRQQNLENL